MSLKGFHIVLISLSSVLSLVFGGWSVAAYRELGGGWYLGSALFSFLAATGLVIYVIWFSRNIRTTDEERRARRKGMRALAVLATLWLIGSDPVPACSVCYGEAEGPMFDAARLGVYLLFGLVAAVQIAFFVFFFYLRKRAREYRRNHPDPGLAES